MADYDLIKKGHLDLIRRGDALAAVRYADADCRGANGACDNLRSIPAVQPTVKPLRYIEPEGETLEQMRDHARQHPLAQSGDMRLVWINEGDLHMHTIFHVAHPTVSPKAQPDDVAALVAAVEALEVACFGEIEDVFAGEVGKEMKAIRAALARVKSKEGFSDEKGVL